MSQTEHPERDGHPAFVDGDDGDDGDDVVSWVSLTVDVGDRVRTHSVYLQTEDLTEVAEAVGECLRAVGASIPDLGVELAVRGL